jgi:hypothetical protein
VWRVPRQRVVFICSSHRPLADPLGRNRGLVSRTRCSARSLYSGRAKRGPGYALRRADPLRHTLGPGSAVHHAASAARCAASGARAHCGMVSTKRSQAIVHSQASPWPRTCIRAPRRDAPGLLQESFALENRGRGECRVPDAPAASRAKW